MVTYPPGASPAVPGGNCIVVAAPLNKCKDDGSDGDPGSTGQASSGNSGSGSSNNSYLNANECKQAKPTLSDEDRQKIYAYAGGNLSSYEKAQLVKRVGSIVGNMTSRPLINLGNDDG